MKTCPGTEEVNSATLSRDYSQPRSIFHGAEVKVTARPFPPYWLEGEEERGAADGYHGTDYLLLQAVASALNFTVAVVPTSDWNEVRACTVGVWACGRV
ncbi:hypothetical protein E2C01_013327 [Portunus trituberculatus]|uniref:Uncharacterized protein n=1 Tax=Portunus trituberculatus TaxID=210409 RepID=A0A5B7DH13_PORTR|nr:hypothetical protein [Portunus trituberculatus]